MSHDVSFLPVRSFPVQIGDVTLAAQTWALSAARQYTQIGGATGECFLTNRAMKAAALTLRGKIAFVETPGEIVAALEKAMREETAFSFAVRGMQIEGAKIEAYEMKEEAGECAVTGQITFVVTEAITSA